MQSMIISSASPALASIRMPISVAASRVSQLGGLSFFMFYDAQTHIFIAGSGGGDEE